VRQRAVKRTKIVNLRKFSLIGTLSLLITACATLQPPKLNSPFDGNYDPITTYLSAFIEKEMRQGDLTGLSIAMVKGDRIVWSEGFGLADKKKSLKATAQTRYRAGSVSKLFNVIAIMQLVEQGKLDLDAPVVDYVSDFQINSRFGPIDDITLRSLLSHQSGMPSDSVSGMWENDPPPLNSLISTWNDSYTVAPANSFWDDKLRLLRCTSR